MARNSTFPENNNSERESGSIVPVVILVLVILGLIPVVIYLYSSPWSGFNIIVRPNDLTTMAKSLWDWLGLILAPLMIAIALIVINESIKRNETKRASNQKLLADKIAITQANQAAFDNYLDSVIPLIVNGSVDNPTTKQNSTSIISTLTALICAQPNFDPWRKMLIIMFLYRLKYLEVERNIDLSFCDFSSAKAPEQIMNGINLSKCNLSRADFRRAKIRGGIFSDAVLINASFTEAKLNNANFQGANLEKAVFKGNGLPNGDFPEKGLSNADLREADFPNTDLRGADFSNADLRGADFSNADLRRAIFANADISGADFSNAAISGADFSNAKNRDKAIFTVTKTT